MKPDPISVRLASEEIGEYAIHWMRERRDKGVRLFLLEGLPVAGKSYLLKLLPAQEFAVFELDNFIQRPLREEWGWLDYIQHSQATDEICSAAKHSPVVIEGPAVGLYLETMLTALNLTNQESARIYIKGMSDSGGQVSWLSGEMLETYFPDRDVFWRSIYSHHAQDRPWEVADLIIERLPEAEL